MAATLDSVHHELAARPVWRGRLHQAAVVLAVPALIALVIAAPGGTARIGAIVYALGLAGMFTVSAIYHRRHHSARSLLLWRRADHATIFAAIAGTSTPVCLLCLSPGRGAAVLAFVWAGAVFGAAIKLLGWRRARIAGAILYIGLGWAMVVTMPSIWRHAGAAALVLFMLGGIFYTVGASFLAAKWPRLRPDVFSFHEVWHACTIVAAACHFGAVWMVVTR